MYISLHGFCEELNIHLEPDYIWLDKTYASLSSTCTVSLTNRNNIPLQYCWTVWFSQQEEDLNLLRYLWTHAKCFKSGYRGICLSQDKFDCSVSM